MNATWPRARDRRRVAVTNLSAGRAGDQMLHCASAPALTPRDGGASEIEEINVRD